MINLVKKIPVNYERTVLEEYYKFYLFQNGKKDLINKNVKFTMDDEKLSIKEKENKSLMDSINTLKNENDKFTFMLSFNDEERLIAVARIGINRNYVHICDIVYTNYPNPSEQVEILNELIPKIEEIASLNGQEVDFEIPINDKAAIYFAKMFDYEQMADEKDVFRTYMFTKKIEKRNNYEQTLSRKQGNKSY